MKRQIYANVFYIYFIKNYCNNNILTIFGIQQQIEAVVDVEK